MTPSAIPNSWAASNELKTRGPILLEAMIGMPIVVNAIQTLLMKKTISHGVLGGLAGCLFQKKRPLPPKDMSHALFSGAQKLVRAFLCFFAQGLLKVPDAR